MSSTLALAKLIRLQALIAAYSAENQSNPENPRCLAELYQCAYDAEIIADELEKKENEKT